VTGFEGVQAHSAPDAGHDGGQTADARQAEPAAAEAPAAERPAEREEPRTERAEQPARQAPQADGQDWRDRALRLQAEMDNFRKRQQRLAQDEIQSERQRLLRDFLPIVDDLERALAAARDGGGLREGVELTHRAALQLLRREGVERIEDRGHDFDPSWHEAVTTVDHRQAGVPPNVIVEVLAPGYRYGEQLLRPARVVVAV
jgi:molecular chaperone GrpE